MKHLKAFAIKFGMVAIVLLSTLTLFEVPVSVILTTTLVLTIPAYLLGDLFIYPRFGNLVASIMDFAFFTAAVWLFMAMFVATTPTTNAINAFFTAIFVTFVEALYHAFYISKITNREQENTEAYSLRPQFGTEFSEEVDVKSSIDKKKR
ncbi:putative membrane protein [Evansella vedderi]|uniref:Membrane protein n=1 Tax=Evansella vedderi TaxID=38282 RepID=A0ABT9ZX72_9BACI|nr:YndM family protein [Evansella vedderi]MDQ0255823.1 putative membrane protein [Evansella vedderi]